MDYYKILGISRGASKEEIKSAYRKQIKKYHPDNMPENPEYAKKQMIEVTEAYAALCDINPLDSSTYSTTRADDMFDWVVNYFKNDKEFRKRFEKELDDVVLDSMTFVWHERNKQPIITDNIEEKVRRLSLYDLEEGEIPEYVEIDREYFDFNLLSESQIRYYNYFKHKVKKEIINQSWNHYKNPYETLFACEIINGLGVDNADEGLQCLINMKYDYDWIYFYWLTSDNSMSFGELNEVMEQKGMRKYDIEKTELDENNVEEIFNYIISRIKSSGYDVSTGALCRKSEENWIIYKKCLMAVIEKFIEIFNKKNKRFVDYILHMNYKEKIKGLYIYNVCPFEGKYVSDIPLKEQKTGEYYWRENEQWYRNKPEYNFSLCSFMAKSVENILRKKNKIYRYLKDEYGNYYEEHGNKKYSFTNVITEEEAREVIKKVVEEIWENRNN